MCVCVHVCVPQNVIQSYFREWLHSTGNIRQVGLSQNRVARVLARGQSLHELFAV